MHREIEQHRIRVMDSQIPNMVRRWPEGELYGPLQEGYNYSKGSTEAASFLSVNGIDPRKPFSLVHNLEDDSVSLFQERPFRLPVRNRGLERMLRKEQMEWRERLWDEWRIPFWVFTSFSIFGVLAYLVCIFER